MRFGLSTPRCSRNLCDEQGASRSFSDGVFAIIITIMVLDLSVPSGPSVEALRSTVPVFLSYVLSFVYVGIYWNNHHHSCTLPNAFPGPILLG